MDARSRAALLVLWSALVALTGCSRSGKGAETAASVASAMTAEELIQSDGIRDVPVRFVQAVTLCSGASCQPCSDGAPFCGPDVVRAEDISARIEQANAVYATAGLRFHVSAIDRVAMPTFHDVSTGDARTWLEVKQELQRALRLRDDTFAPAQRHTLTEWLILASAIGQPPWEVLVWVPSASRGSFGSYPQEGRCLIQSPTDLGAGTWNLSHELGHYLGLPHAFGAPFNLFQWDLKPGYLLNPATQQPVVLSDFWDLVYRPGTPNLFYRTKQAAAADEPLLRTIDGTDAAHACNRDVRCCSQGCRVYCNVDGERRVHGDPALEGGVAFSVPREDGSVACGPNVMSYIPGDPREGCIVGLSRSQVLQIRRGLRWDVPNTNLRGITGGRPWLGRPPRG